ncbi:hypothetical protein K0B96_07955 [Horticoccus luteus]|uniref:CheR-type methyltransferase domain-containing protein n=1 Tax=Horticoccus luteus TaxID=2862869 RepID=A0A8F9XMX0_9BACT|nr:CheR family methyltransferase [Horticoccus luteus]QYM80529.1 hypothetical protein K0B96_07955 [Horticoccus luteus]
MNPAVFRGGALNRRLPACLRLLRVPTEGAAQALLQRRPDLVPATLTAILIGVTEFFREPAVFEALRDIVLPQLAAEREPIRVAGFGVSHGQELYSMAMLLEEAGLLQRSELVGIDCRSDAIIAAAAGRYDGGDLGGIEPARRERWRRLAWTG